VWTQEHNGRKQAGGVIDAGHIRTDAPCVWWNPAGSQGSVPIAGEDMPLTTDDVHTILTAKSLPADTPTMSLGTVVMDAQAKARAAAAGVDALTGKVDALAAKIAALPTTAAPAAPLSDADKDDIAKRVADLLAGRLES